MQANRSSRSATDGAPADDVDAVLAASRALVAVSARSIAAAGDVTLPQYRMLVVLGEAARNLRELAQALDVAPSTATRMVDRLVTADLVARSVPADNRREVHLALTAAGQDVVASVTARRRRDIAAVLEQLDEAERADVVAALDAFAAAADRTWGEAGGR